MRYLRITIQAFFSLALIVLLTGCLTVRIFKNVKDAGRHFEWAHRRIENIHRNNPDRRGPAHRIHALFFEASDRELIRISAPFWVINSCLDFRMTASGEEVFAPDSRYEIDWKDIRDLQHMGPGLLVEVDEENEKVLIWLD